ncbi:arginine-tRNA-protein transferase [Flammeovirga yaeyamensis]|uniref:Arginine-tRNA-protein transferase n=1 Tax=Flammeovirga yaeyamensis TaxID=367791 RepID=A0AAX1MXT7_9BACT|nr:arginine-tRNA-protein transferase [Flammeovirga yaeyamensis]MBB3696421.1 arginine-tRNA-protein transferase [Flammeovirga yaeyamensis]NMF35100.1 arginine-tRNA-protein transferase [Flammeovirga yaeyamensis]QWG00079.1 arginine-tRNA-protein transferase [Flammeovirga yaeyamensis]
MKIQYIVDDFIKSYVTPSQYDYLLAAGYRHFGENFFRYNINFHQDKVCNVLPLRIPLINFSLSKSQKKILNKAKSFTCSIDKVTIDETTNELFDIHKQKFVDNIPNSIYDFLSKTNTQNTPTKIYELRVFDNTKTIAISYIGMGEQSLSSIYGMYDPNYSKYSLGLLTMLLEIQFGLANDFIYYYHGYSYDIPSFYDYKKKFKPLEVLNWNENKWQPYSG